eukprot:3370163-Ditylum_brightwellii.AAC.1
MGITQLLENNTTDAPALPDSYKAQLSLGFMSLFDGIIHQEWTEQQDDHLQEKRLWTPCSNGTQWSVQIIKFNWDKFFELWTTHNKKVHGTNKKARNALKAN